VGEGININIITGCDESDGTTTSSSFRGTAHVLSVWDASKVVCFIEFDLSTQCVSSEHSYCVCNGTRWRRSSGFRASASLTLYGADAWSKSIAESLLSGSCFYRTHTSVRFRVFALLISFGHAKRFKERLCMQTNRRRLPAILALELAYLDRVRDLYP